MQNADELSPIFFVNSIHNPIVNMDEEGGLRKKAHARSGDGEGTVFSFLMV